MITCFINKLNSTVPEARVFIKSRLWNNTFLEDYLDVAEVHIYSQGIVEILNAPFLTEKNPDNDEATLFMAVKRGIETVPPPPPLEWWIILLAVIGGLLLLIIIIIILWKCGFFERKTMAYKYASVTQAKASGK